MARVTHTTHIKEGESTDSCVRVARFTPEAEWSSMTLNLGEPSALVHLRLRCVFGRRFASVNSTPRDHAGAAGGFTSRVQPLCQQATGSITCGEPIPGAPPRPGAPRDYAKAIPLPKRIERINRLYDEGHTIVYWTARGTMTGIPWFQCTRGQLEEWGCRYHELRMGKPAYDLFIDDKNIHSDAFFDN